MRILEWQSGVIFDIVRSYCYLPLKYLRVVFKFLLAVETKTWFQARCVGEKTSMQAELLNNRSSLGVSVWIGARRAGPNSRNQRLIPAA
jgi:hypothetical protein